MLPFLLVPLLLGVPADGAQAPVPAAPTAARDRAVAFGLLLDCPPPPAVIDDAVRIAERLRAFYGIETGNALADREAAARRAAAFIEDLVFPPDQVRAVAAALGFDLDPAHCRSACRDIRDLAEVELRKRALLNLLASADARPSPCP